MYSTQPEALKAVPMGERKPGQIDIEISGMRADIDRAQSLVRRLRDSLEPVMRSPEPEPCAPPVTTPFPSVPMAGTVRELRMEIDRTSGVLEDILNRLGI